MEKINSTKFNTPCYLYSMQKLELRLKEIKNYFKKVEILYSAKANSNIRILKKIKEYVYGIDVASIGEIDRALSAGFEPSSISYIGPGKTKKDLEYAINVGVGIFVVESVEEIERILSISENPENLKIQIRVNISLESKSSSLTMGGQASQFGIDEAEVDNVIKRFKDKLKIIGIHIYKRSQIFDLKELEEQFVYSINLAKELETSNQIRFSQNNIGGGFPIKYYENQREHTIAEVAKSIDHISSGNMKWTVEMGRFITAPAGQFVTQVEYIKKSREKNYAILNGGFTCNSLIAGVGQVLKKNFLVETNAEGELMKYTLAGPSCTPFDTLASEIELPTLREGDYIIFKNCGAYGLDYSPVNFLALPKAEEYFI